jgi:hypothetical protein
VPSKRGRNKRREHVYQRTRVSNGSFRGHHHCPVCGKWCYAKRNDAEHAVGLLHPGATVHYYLCGDWWHFTSMTAAQVADFRAREAEDLAEPEEMAG